MVMYGAGLRISEANPLKVTEIDGPRGVILVHHGKGNKAREAKLSKGLYQWLRQYWARERPPLPYLFASKKTQKPPTQQTIRKAIADAAKRAGHLDKCQNCGYEHPSYNSCRNRHCPKCQALAQELRPLAAFAKDTVYGALFRAASCTLLEFGERRLRATIGATLVLHTWARDLSFHPHVHAIVTGGGLSRDGTQWHSVRRAFLFPVKLMGRVFRGKMIDELKRAYENHEFARFREFDDPEAFSKLVSKLENYRSPTVIRRRGGLA